MARHPCPSDVTDPPWVWGLPRQPREGGGQERGQGWVTCSCQPHGGPGEGTVLAPNLGTGFSPLAVRAHAGDGPAWSLGFSLHLPLRGTAASMGS